MYVVVRFAMATFSPAFVPSAFFSPSRHYPPVSSSPFNLPPCFSAPALSSYFPPAPIRFSPPSIFICLCFLNRRRLPFSSRHSPPFSFLVSLFSVSAFHSPHSFLPPRTSDTRLFRTPSSGILAFLFLRLPTVYSHILPPFPRFSRTSRTQQCPRYRHVPSLPFYASFFFSFTTFPPPIPLFLLFSALFPPPSSFPAPPHIFFLHFAFSADNGVQNGAP